MKPVQIDNSVELKSQFSNPQLFQLFKEQILKDFTLTGIDLELDIINLSPKELYHYLTQEITYLTDNQFDKLLNLLYRIDIPETKISNCIKNTPENHSIYENLTFLILKRIWMKIWYRYNY